MSMSKKDYQFFADLVKNGEEVWMLAQPIAEYFKQRHKHNSHLLPFDEQRFYAACGLEIAWCDICDEMIRPNEYNHRHNEKNHGFSHTFAMDEKFPIEYHKECCPVCMSGIKKKVSE